MIGTLTNPIGFLNDARLSVSVSVSPITSSNRRVKKACNAVTDSDTVVVDSTAARRRSSLYEVLRVKRNATPNEIKTAYRNLAKIYHPDSSNLKQQDDRNFIEIHDAYATLNDPAERAMYDMKLNTVLGCRSGLYTVGVQRRGFYTSRRWETDQCW